MKLIDVFLVVPPIKVFWGFKSVGVSRLGWALSRLAILKVGLAVLGVYCIGLRNAVDNHEIFSKNSFGDLTIFDSCKHLSSQIVILAGLLGFWELWLALSLLSTFVVGLSRVNS